MLQNSHLPIAKEFKMNRFFTNILGNVNTKEEPIKCADVPKPRSFSDQATYDNMGLSHQMWGNYLLGKLHSVLFFCLLCFLKMCYAIYSIFICLRTERHPSYNIQGHKIEK